MKKDQPLCWPPVIEFTRAPWYVRVRDILLTLIAWAFIIYLLWDGLVLVVDYFSKPIFQLTKKAPPDWVKVWHELETFLIVAAVGMTWIALSGCIRRRRLRLAARVTPPPPLTLEEHAAIFALQPRDIEHWRKIKTVVVEFGPNSRINCILQPDGIPVATTTRVSDKASPALPSRPPH
jgi:poly-beta-1,6-N-acetyl-D-glucosamine biosynthesis protein PgaD